ncbi:MAG: asparagine synthase (glutamine-hydrolyzing) [Candidatus Latescibacteria bacterium]|nr:asparagine synthase (glutamine-hydrolyzing) [Candidatus Latescibacterota bacterium]
MCGICGVVGRLDEREIGLMTDSMAHRGPDGRGVRTFPGEPPAALGHRRLAIIDPTPAGAQPMSFADRWWITYNGEIYNFRELRADLEQRGERFISDCDTEVILRLFALEGPAMLERLNGIFAFAIWDNRDRKLFLARDRLGVKPLYWTQREGVFAFASELRALLPLIGRPTLDETAIADYFMFLWVPDPKTAFKEIRKLPPGHFAWAGATTFTTHQYWDLQFSPENLPESEWRDRVAETVERSVRRQMVSDVPLGAFLSGGVDSSAIVAAMSEQGQQRVSTYTVGFDQEDLRHEIVPDDLVHARRIGKLFKTDYFEYILKPDVLDLLPKAVWHLEEPVADPAAISTYLICREASTRMPVMLSGMGADEIFAGYPRYLAYGISRSLDRIPRPVKRGLEWLVSGAAHPGRPGRLRGPRRNLWKFMRGARLSPTERYLAFSTYYSTSELGSLLTSGFAESIGAYDPLTGHRALFDDVGDVDELSKLLYVDAKTFLPCLNLTYTDKMAMAASVEVRVPLLDDELVALAARIPSQLKLHGRQRKYIFKKSQEAALPHDIVWRKKAGFGAPIRSWLVKDLAPLLSDALSEGTLARRGIVEPATVARLTADNISGLADNSLQLYALLNLELWMQTFLDRTWRFEDLPGAPIALPT